MNYGHFYLIKLKIEECEKFKCSDVPIEERVMYTPYPKWRHGPRRFDQAFDFCRFGAMPKPLVCFIGQKSSKTKNRSLEQPRDVRGTATRGFRGSVAQGRRPIIKEIDESMIKTTRCEI